MGRILKGLAMLIGFIALCIYGYYFSFVERNTVALLGGTVVVGIIAAVGWFRKVRNTRY
ncbi:hypothetical protein [Enterococcus sp. 5B3_DIV0040]|uniref:hypothetical protein n=1 Tax=Enterococcus sp. 5B3_DIV0040 TaxID=1834182 RepID=UPI000B6E2E87|nr:hypothetical protein [Enterococcus sp. 5B3_DIV0040]OTO03225.1 hypothetical protein A5883_000190 [Enterococcus sp. 5B3_DIV0040]